MFRNGDAKDLARVIMNVMEMKEGEKNKVRKEARRTAEGFEWSKIVGKIEGLIES